MSNGSKCVGKWLGISVVLVSGCFAGTAMAACMVVDATIYTIGQGAVVTVGEGTPPDAVIKSSQASNSSKDWKVSCTSGTYDFVSEHNGKAAIYPIREESQSPGEHAGIGVRIYIDEQGEGGEKAIPWTLRRTFSSVTTVSNPDTVRYEIVRLSGPVVPGKMRPSTAASSSVGGQNYRLFNIDNLSIARPSCDISASSLNQSVALGTHESSKLKNPGDATPWIPFQLVSQNCDNPAGIVADITFGTGADADTQNPKLYKVTPGTVRGLGIGLAQDTPGSEEVLPGQKTSLAAVATGARYRFKARMQRTSAALVPGKISKGIVVQVDFR